MVNCRLEYGIYWNPSRLLIGFPCFFPTGSPGGRNERSLQTVGIAGFAAIFLAAEFPTISPRMYKICTTFAVIFRHILLHFELFWQKGKSPKPLQLLGFRGFSNGRGRRARTLGTRFWRPLLYQLSYTPISMVLGFSQ